MKDYTKNVINSLLANNINPFNRSQCVAILSECVMPTATTSLYLMWLSSAAKEPVYLVERLIDRTMESSEWVYESVFETKEKAEEFVQAISGSYSKVNILNSVDYLRLYQND